MARSRVFKYPQKQARTDSGASPARMDGWQNLLTGLGDTNADKRWAGNITKLRLDADTCADLWRYDDVAARIVEVPVEEMTREGFDVLIPGDKDGMEQVTQALDDLAWDAALVEAAHYQRAYGGGAILVGANDGQKDLSKPLNEDAIRSIDFITVLKPREAQGITYYADPGAPKFGQTERYRIVPELASTSATFPWMPEVHESRVIEFQGRAVSRRQLRENFGWGDSVFVRIFEVIRDFAASYSGAASLVQDFAQPVFEISGLREMLAADDGTNRLKIRLQAMNLARSIIRAVICDAGDSSGMGKERFHREPTPVTGLPDLLDRLAQRMASAADMPVDRLLGEQTKGGMGDKGQSKIEWWEKHIANLQQRDLYRPSRRMVELLLKCKSGPTKGKVPPNWSIRFRPLSQLSPLEESQRRLAIAQADQVYISAGVVTPEEVATSRFGGDEYSIETVLDDDLRDSLDEAIDRKSEATIGKPEPVIGDLATEVPNAVDPTLQNDDYPGAQAGSAAISGGKNPNPAPQPKRPDEPDAAAQAPKDDAKAAKKKKGGKPPPTNS